VIGGRAIALGNGDGEYGISESALALLRTLESDHSPTQPLAERLIPHGCGTMLMFSCPIGIDWSVSHVGGRVCLHRIVRYDDIDTTQAAHFPGLDIEITEDEYRRQVVAFALRAKEPFAGIEKTFEDDFDRQQYEEFWDEYDRLFNRAAR
jgi:hypothetical protein